MRTHEQQRAEYAFGFVSNTPNKKAFSEAVVGAPVLVMSNGLMQALAFYRAKEKDYGEVLEAVLRPLGVVLGCGASFEAVMPALQRCEPEQYMQATEEALETLKWLRHFAKALA